MTQIPCGIDLVTHALLEYFGLGKTSVGFALPYLYSIAGDTKHAASAGFKADPR